MKNIRLFMPIVVAVALGPLIAGLVFCALTAANNVFGQIGLPIDDLLKSFGVYILFAYIEGGPVALLAGLLLSIWMIRYPPGFAVANVAAAISVGLFRLAASIDTFSRVNGVDLVRTNFGLTLAVAFIAA